MGDVDAQCGFWEAFVGTTPQQVFYQTRYQHLEARLGFYFTSAADLSPPSCRNGDQLLPLGTLLALRTRVAPVVRAVLAALQKLLCTFFTAATAHGTSMKEIQECERALVRARDACACLPPVSLCGLLARWSRAVGVDRKHAPDRFMPQDSSATTTTIRTMWLSLSRKLAPDWFETHSAALGCPCKADLVWDWKHGLGFDVPTKQQMWFWECFFEFTFDSDLAFARETCARVGPKRPTVEKKTAQEEEDEEQKGLVVLPAAPVLPIVLARLATEVQRIVTPLRVMLHAIGEPTVPEELRTEWQRARGALDDLCEACDMFAGDRSDPAVAARLFPLMEVPLGRFLANLARLLGLTELEFEFGGGTTLAGKVTYLQHFYQESIVPALQQMTMTTTTTRTTTLPATKPSSRNNTTLPPGLDNDAAAADDDPKHDARAPLPPLVLPRPQCSTLAMLPSGHVAVWQRVEQVLAQHNHQTVVAGVSLRRVVDEARAVHAAQTMHMPPPDHSWISELNAYCVIT